MKLTDPQIELYSRQILLRELGGVGQRRLLTARCLLVGRGVATDAAASYLAGAGIGALDLLEGAPSPFAATAIAFAALPGRSPDVVVRRRGVASGASLSEVDVAIVAGALANGDSLLTGSPRLGSIRLTASREGGDVELALAPASVACFACLPAPYEDEGPSPGPGEAALAACFAGVMAAQAACRWIAGLATDDAPRLLHLRAGAATWEERTVTPGSPCPRGCRGGGGTLQTAGSA